MPHGVPGVPHRASCGGFRRIPDLKDPAQQAEWRRCQKLVEKEATLVRSMARPGRGTSTPAAAPSQPPDDAALKDAGTHDRTLTAATVRRGQA